MKYIFPHGKSNEEMAAIINIDIINAEIKIAGDDFNTVFSLSLNKLNFLIKRISPNIEKNMR